MSATLVIAARLKRKIGLVLLGLFLVFASAFGALPGGLFGGAEIAQAEETVGTTQLNQSNKSFFSDPLGSIAQAASAAVTRLVNFFLLVIARVLLKIMELLAYLFSIAIEFLKWAVDPRYIVKDPAGTIIQDVSIWQIPDISVGWRIVRDVINGFFIVVLIAIAIATIIRFQAYNFRSTLPRLIIATLLVNFSRTIALLGINFADAVMRTFAKPLADILPVYALGLRLPALTALGNESIGNVFGTSPNLERPPLEMVTILVSILVGIVMMAFALGGVFMFCVLLLVRILVLWFLMILSPLAFFLWGAPGRAASYWGQWLEEYVKHVIIGPIGAFFLYLICIMFVTNLRNTYGYSPTANIPVAGSTVALDPKILIGYFISLGMMFVALEIVEQLGVRGGNLARQIGIEGIAKGGYARRLAGAVAPAYGVAADWLTKKTGIPRGLLQPGIAIEGIKGGLAQKRERLAKEAIQKQAKTLAKLEGTRFGTTALAYGLLTGDSGVVANIGLKDLNTRTSITGPGIRGMDTLLSQGTSYLADKSAVNGFRNLTDPQQGAVGKMTGAQLQSLAANKDELLKLHGDIGSWKRAADVARGAGNAETAAYYDNLVAGARGRYDELRQDADVDALMKDDEKLDKIKDFAEMLKKPGVTVGEKETIGSDIGKIYADKNFDQRGQAAIAEVKRRQKNIQVAKAAARSDFVDKVNDAMGDAYQKDVKYDLEDLYGDVLANSNPENKAKFAAALLKGAEQGYADDLRLRINPEFDGTVDGMKKFVQYLEKDMGFGEDTATLIGEMQGRSAGANKLADTAWVKLDGLSKDFKLIEDEGERNKIIEKRVSNQSLEDILRKFKRDGLGYKDKAGKYVMNAGIASRLSKEDFSSITKNPMTLGRIDRNTKQMLLDNASKIGLTPEQESAIRSSLK